MELIDGELIKMAPIGQGHSGIVTSAESRTHTGARPTAATTTHRPGEQLALAVAPEIVVKLALVSA